MFSAMILAIAAHGVEVEPGGMYEGGQELTASPFGITVTVPPGQMATVSEDAISIGSLLSALGTTVTVSADNEAAIRAQLAEPLVLGDTTWTAGSVSKKGSHLVAELQGATLLGGARVGRLETVPGGHGWTALVITSGKPKHAGQLPALHDAIVASVRLGEPTTAASSGAKAGAAAGGSAKPGAVPKLSRTGPWAAALSGRQLRYMRTTDTTTTDRRLYLCADGRAFYAYESSGATTQDTPDEADASYAAQDAAEGWWGIEGDTLIAASAQDRAEWALSRGAEGELLLDGYRWFVIDLEGWCK